MTKLRAGFHGRGVSFCCPRVAFVLVCLLFCGAMAGCGPSRTPPSKDKPFALERLRENVYPDFSDTLGYKGLVPCIEASLAYFARIPKTRSFAFGKDAYSAGHLTQSLKKFRSFVSNHPTPGELKQFIRDQYLVYESVGNSKNRVLFTGYYEPIYPGSLEPDPFFPFPLFSLPVDLLKIDLSLFSDVYKGHKKLVARKDKNQVVPYYSRGQINHMDGFSKRAKPVAWLASRVDRFFLEIQGSGRIKTRDERLIRVHYAGSNGNAYRSVGRYLINQGEISKKEMSMGAIRKWLEANPHRMDEVLHQNQSLVFFQVEEGGPFGSLGVELTPLRSIATDSKIFPRGGLCFAMAALPDPANLQTRELWQPGSLFVMNQDTGGAIKGPGRADLFCGSGKYAEFTAGNMNIPGRLFFLVLKP